MSMSLPERATRHAELMRAMRAPMTRANLLRLADQRAHSARRLRFRSKVSPIARQQRLAALESARAFYYLARHA